MQSNVLMLLAGPYYYKTLKFNNRLSIMIHAVCAKQSGGSAAQPAARWSITINPASLFSKIGFLGCYRLAPSTPVPLLQAFIKEIIAI